jgi:erythromycin esterase
MKNYRCFCLLCFLPAYLFAQVDAQIGTQTTPIYPISTRPNQDLSEQLMPLQTLFSSKSMVGMGEATHGTREFFEIKAGVFQWLVSTCNYRVFGIEATYGGCCYINDFVQSGKGNIDSVMVYLDFWTWQTEEVRDLILWIKDYNLQAKAPDKVSFYGFDMQNFYAPVQYLNDFTKQHCPAQYDSLQAISFPVLGKTELQIYRLLRKKEFKFEDTLLQTHRLLTDWLLRNKKEIETTHSGHQFQALQFCLDNFGQAIKSLSVENQSKFRDSCMAYNALQIQKYENKKMFIWAHNGHINLAYPDDRSRLMGLLMGGHLKKNLGDAYYAIGFVFNQGSFQAIQGPKSIGSAIFKYLFARKKLYQGLKPCLVPVQAKNTFTNALSGTGYQSYFVDIAHSVNPVFSTLLKTYDVGAVFMNYKRCTSSIHAKRQFDGIIYLDQTSRARPVHLKK